MGAAWPAGGVPCGLDAALCIAAIDAPMSPAESCRDVMEEGRGFLAAHAHKHTRCQQQSTPFLMECRLARTSLVPESRRLRKTQGDPDCWRRCDCRLAT